MKKYLFAIIALCVACFSFVALAQGKAASITVTVGEQYSWTPFTSGTIDNVTSDNEAMASVSVKKPRTVVISGKKEGEVTITAHQGKKTVKIKVKVVAMLTPWKGHYVYNPPRTEFHIEYVDLKSGDYYKTGNIDHYQVDFRNDFFEGTSKGASYRSLFDAFPKVDGCHDEDMTGEPEKAPLGYGAHEMEFMPHMRAASSDEDDFQRKLGRLYVGTEEVCGVKCWVFDTKGTLATYYKIWIDPANGCCLKLVDKENGGGHEVKVYDLHYHQWTPDFLPTPPGSWDIYWGD